MSPLKFSKKPVILVDIIFQKLLYWTWVVLSGTEPLVLFVEWTMVALLSRRVTILVILADHIISKVKCIWGCLNSQSLD